MLTYTFVCLTARDVSTVIDVQHFDARQVAEGAPLVQAETLLSRHASAVAVEIWAEEACLETVRR